MISEEIQKACKEGDLRALESVVKLNPGCINELDPRLGWAPLYRCTVYGIITTAEVLLSLGANPNIQNRLGQAPLHQASELNNQSMLKLLLNFHADPNVQQNDGDTPLHLACYKGHLEIIRILLEQGADPNVQNNVLGRTPLHCACERNQLEIVKLLIVFKANATIRDKNNFLPNELTENSEILEIVKGIRRSGKGFYDDETGSKDSIYEPESEKAIMSSNRFKSMPQFSFGESKKSALFNWLLTHKLECLYDTLQYNGFDDLDMLVEAMKSNVPLTDEILKQSGINKIGLRLRLLSKLEEQSVLSSRYSICNDSKSMWCLSFNEKSYARITNNLKEWLNEMKLGYLYQNFIDCGFEDIEQIMTIMKSTNPITEEILEYDIGVKKIGHRHRILSKLNNCKYPQNSTNTLRLDKNEKIEACESCLLM